jgi:hypothetical protein
MEAKNNKMKRRTYSRKENSKGFVEKYVTTDAKIHAKKVKII